MKLLAGIFNFSVAIFLLSCNPWRTMTSTPTIELKEYKGVYPKTDSLLLNILEQYPQYFDFVLKNKEELKVQVIYTQINRLAGNRPVFTNYYFNIDPERYYYPASTIKFPVAALALQKLNELNIAGLDRKTTMITEPGVNGYNGVYNEPTSEDGRPTIEHYIKKILLVSDNDASNRLYEFLGQQYLNNTLHDMGFDSVQLIHRLDIAMTEDENRLTNGVKFYDSGNKIIYEQPPVKSKLVYQKRNTFLGKGFMSGGKLIAAPFDFSRKNRLGLSDLHTILRSVVFPRSVPKPQRFNLTAEDYSFLYRYMSMLPAESRYPQYDSSYNDAYVKFLMYGSQGKIKDSSIRIFNKVGDAYGFLTDAAYIVDFKNKIEFILSATIYCNSDGIFNDDHYDYEKLGYPFMKNLGNVIYDFELKRKRKNKPDLSHFIFNYGNE